MRPWPRLTALLLTIGTGAAVGCGGPGAATTTTPDSSDGVGASATPQAAPLASADSVASAPDGSGSVPPAASAPPAATEGPGTPASQAGMSCGMLGCLLFDRPEDAFAHLLAAKPLVLAVGETHAQKGAEAVASSTERFTRTLLPLLQPLASDLVLELWVADGSCGAQEKQVAKQQAPVTQQQAPTNTNEFALLRARAVALGLRPHVLRPSCEEYDRIAKAGADAVPEMLSMITRLTVRTTEQLLVPRATSPDAKMIVAYGGAMHNDLAPPPERAQWSFGAELQKSTAGRYVELDLIVPEFVRDAPSWRALPWYDHFKPDAHPEKTTLFNPSPGSYVLIFPRTR